jgi:uncharacterized cupin superfamily protein
LRNDVAEAQLTDTASGLAPATDGWFVVNVRDAEWQSSAFGDACFFESDAATFSQLGIAIRVLWPGWSRWLYHAESAQEDFLVLDGEALLLVEEQERRLRAWDFFHCPQDTAHAFVAVGDRPCAILMVGARPIGHTYRYPRSELALRHAVGVKTETRSPKVAQAELAASQWEPARRGLRAVGLPWEGQ